MNRSRYWFIAALSMLLVWMPIPPAPSVNAALPALGTGLPARTAQEIAAQWKKLMHPTADFTSPYASAPSARHPYAPGSLKAEYIQDGLNAVNYYRFISGLPYDLTATAKMNKQAQYGSVLLAAEDDFSHTPAKPANMSKSFYTAGYASTTTANIYAYYGKEEHILSRAVDAYMEDSDIYNLSVVGHRRWILNPRLQQIGFGQASNDKRWTYSVLQVFDQSRAKPIAYNYVAYPAQGDFPINRFGPNDAWSVSLNMDKFKAPVKSAVTVTLVRVKDKKTWKLSAKHGKVAETGNYFNVETNGYGSGTAIIFRPGGIAEYKEDDRYQVTIQGLRLKSGAAQKLAYTVHFVDADKSGIIETE
ncbi:CAP domain-containing protein [Cohnella boryungensis]|uniref:CAP domain-containing protein n=1 Tax=Cohnella boryungensis TaxID=768479 RepID=A0ABV8S6M9_9BACL